MNTTGKRIFGLILSAMPLMCCLVSANAQNTALLEGSFGVGIHTTSIVSEPGESDDFY